LAPVLRAPSSKASLNGRITSVKAVIVKANVAAINLGTNERCETTTNTEGEYYLPSLPPGLQRIEIQKSGFMRHS
jgi:Carboxypeptidase regulatory-like domain